MKLTAIISTKDVTASPERIARQNICIQTWHEYANRVILLNKKQDIADLKFVECVEPLEDHANLAQIVKTAALGRGMFDYDSIAVIPCDVMLKGSFAPLEKYMDRRQIHRCWAATSHRIENNEEIEWAFDFFAATKKIWKEFRDVPSYLKMGEPMWDVWLNSKLNIHVGGHRYVNLSDMRVVDHEPHEGGREMHGTPKGVDVSGWVPPKVKP